MSHDRLPPTEMFAADVEQLIRDVEEFKQYQRSGQDSVRMYRIFSADAADKSVTSVGFNNRRFRLTFTPAPNDFDTSIVYRMEYTYVESGSGNTVQVRSERESVESDNDQTWLFVVQGSNAFPRALVTFKFYFWASGNGTFSITDL